MMTTVFDTTVSYKGKFNGLHIYQNGVIRIEITPAVFEAFGRQLYIKVEATK